MTAPTRPAIDEATDRIQAVRNAWWPTQAPISDELDALTAELLRRMADEKIRK